MNWVKASPGGLRPGDAAAMRRWGNRLKTSKLVVPGGRGRGRRGRETREPDGREDVNMERRTVLGGFFLLSTAPQSSVSFSLSISLSLSACLISACLPTDTLVRLCICARPVHLHACVFACLLACPNKSRLSVYLCACLSVCLPVCLRICLSVCLCIGLSIYMPTYLCICP